MTDPHLDELRAINARLQSIEQELRQAPRPSYAGKKFSEMSKDEQVAFTTEKYGPDVPDIDPTKATVDEKLAFIEDHGVDGYRKAVGRFHQNGAK
jgi:hypothetical protein